jgi:hypothetical protein
MPENVTFYLHSVVLHFVWLSSSRERFPKHDATVHKIIL